MLMPKRTKYRKMMKGRNRGKSFRCTSLTQGEVGLKALEHGRINSRQIEAARIAMTRKIILFDEFPRFGKLEYIISLPALGRSYKVIVILISQDFAQIKATYEQTTVDTILSTTAHKIVYPQMNPETAKKFSEMIGNHEVEQTSVSESKSGKSTSFTLVSKPLVSPQDILSQDKNKIYLLELIN